MLAASCANAQAGATLGADREDAAAGPKCDTSKSALVAQLSGAPSHDEVDAQYLVRNLDTGEARRVGQGDVNGSFVGAQSLPSLLRGAKESCWRGWWTEKQRRDELLWQTAEKGSVDDLRQLLVAMGADGGPPAAINSRALHGQTALHLAAFTGEPLRVELLLRARAHVEGRTDVGRTALHAACQRGHEEVARLLVSWCPQSCNEADEDGNLPLHLAAARGHVPAMSVLLELGDDMQLRARNHLSQCPGEVAGDIDTATFLQRHTAEGATVGGEDRYAGRTPLPGGAVLLPNARSDVVRRLLQKAQGLTRPRASTIDEHVEATPRSTPSTNRPSSPDSSPCRRSLSCGCASPVPADDGEMMGGASPMGFTLGSGGGGSGDTSGAEVALATSPLGGQGGGGSSPGTPKARTFARLRQTESGIEEVGPESFELVKVLGKGAFGEVFQVRHKRSRMAYAMKILQKSRIARGGLLRYAVTERNVLSYLQHPYIVALHYAFQTPSHLVLVLQYCSGGNLQQRISEERRLSEAVACLYGAEVLTALGHLHERLVVFRDLKPENCVLDDEGARSFCGSLAFLAPEILQRRGHGRTVDLYGLGVLIFAMLTGGPPFYHRDCETLLENIRRAPLRMPSCVTPVAASLIEALMQREPSHRLGAQRTDDVQSHAFFAPLDFAALLRREIHVPLGATREAPAARAAEAPARTPPLCEQGRRRRWRACCLGGGDSGDVGRGQGAVSGWEFSAGSPVRVA